MTTLKTIHTEDGIYEIAKTISPSGRGIVSTRDRNTGKTVGHSMSDAEIAAAAREWITTRAAA